MRMSEPGLPDHKARELLTAARPVRQVLPQLSISTVSDQRTGQVPLYVGRPAPGVALRHGCCRLIRWHSRLPEARPWADPEIQICLPGRSDRAGCQLRLAYGARGGVPSWGAAVEEDPTAHAHPVTTTPAATTTTLTISQRLVSSWRIVNLAFTEAPFADATR
jgi:hypothetical protein